jgi:WD40 repeat protein
MLTSAIQVARTMAQYYDLYGMEPVSFQEIVQRLVLKRWPDARVYGGGPDGGRDAEVVGKFSFDEGSPQCEGRLIIQVKYRKERCATPKRAGAWVIDQLKSDMEKFGSPPKHEAPDYYIVVTNVDLTAVPKLGTDALVRDALAECANNLNIKKCDVWDGNKVRQLLASHPGIADGVADFTTPGHVLSQVLKLVSTLRWMLPASLSSLLLVGLATLLVGLATLGLVVRGPIRDDGPGAGPPIRVPVPVVSPAQEFIPVLNADGHSGRVHRLLFNKDRSTNGLELISISEDKTIRRWDFKSGTSRALIPPIGAGLAGMLYAAAISPDGSTLAAAGYTPGGHESGRIYLISLQDEQLTGVLTGHDASIASLCFSPDGRLLASASRDHNVILWDWQNRRQIHRLGHDEEVRSACFSPDGQRLASASLGGSISLWSVKDGTRGAPLSLDKKVRILGLAWSPDGKILASGDDNGIVALRDPDNSDSPARSRALGFRVTSLCFSASSRLLLVTPGSVKKESKTFECFILNAHDLSDFKKFSHPNVVSCGTFSSDGGSEYVATAGGGQNEIYVRGVHSDFKSRLSSQGHVPYDLEWLPDQDSIEWSETLTELLDCPDAPRDRLRIKRAFRFSDLTLGGSPGVRTEKRMVKFVQTKNHIQVSREGQEEPIDIKLPDETDRANEIVRLSQTILAVGSNLGLFWFDVRHKKLHELRGHNGGIVSVAPAQNGEYLISSSLDQTIRVWQPTRNEDRDNPLVLTLFVAGGDWIAWTPNGCFASSDPGRSRLMEWCVVSKSKDTPVMSWLVPPGNLGRERPDLIRTVFAGAKTPWGPEDGVDHPGVLPGSTQFPDVVPISVTIAGADGDSTYEPLSPFHVEATVGATSLNPVASIRLCLDGRPYHGRNPFAYNYDPPRQKKTEVEWPVVSLPGPHNIIVEANCKFGTVSSHPIGITVRGKPEIPSLYVLAVGVSDGPDLSDRGLAGAAASAKSLAHALCTVPRDQFKRVDVRQLTETGATTGNLSRPTTGNLRRELNELKGHLVLGDSAIFYFRGRISCDAEGPYLLTSDCTPANPASDAFPGADLVETLATTSGRLLVMLDALSVQPTNTAPDAQSRDPIDLVMRGLAADECRVSVVRSSLIREAPRAIGPTGNSLFVQALIEGISGKADCDHDKSVDQQELQVFLTCRLSELSKEQQNPLFAWPIGVPLFTLPIVKPEIEATK